MPLSFGTGRKSAAAQRQCSMFDLRSERHRYSVELNIWIVGSGVSGACCTRYHDQCDMLWRCVVCSPQHTITTYRSGQKNKGAFQDVVTI